MNLRALPATLLGRVRSAIGITVARVKGAVARVMPGRRPGPDAVGDQPGTPRSAQPNATWTVAQLRAEARARGLEGTSRMRKAELIEALRR